MRLSESEVLEIVKQRKGSEVIEKGANYQSRLKVVTESLNRLDLQKEQGYKEFTNHLAATLPNKKFKRVMEYFTYPLSVVNLTADIVGDLYRVFDARNSHFDIVYNSEREAAAMQPIFEDMQIRDYIEQEAKKALKCEPNTMVVVDKDEAGKPYLVTVCNTKLLGFELDEKQALKYVLFLHSKGEDEAGEYENYALYCSEFYRVVTKRGSSYALALENPHNYGYVPAHFIIDQQLNSVDPYSRFNFLAPVLGALHDWTKFYYYKEYADHYSTFPVVEQAFSECKDDNCSNGIITRPIVGDGGEVNGYTTPMPCRTCEDKSLIGPGTVVRVELSEDGEADARGVFKTITPDTSSLEYVSRKLTEKENFIKVNTVGFNAAMNKDAMNVPQIRGLMESKKKPLLAIKTCLDRLYTWIVQTSCLAYDIQAPTVHADHGTEFFLMTEDDIQSLYEKAKTAGLPEAEVAQIYTLLIETKYKGNPSVLQRHKLLADLDPFPYDSLMDLKEKAALGMVSQSNLKIKGNLSNFVRRFERENGNIVAFGIELEYSKKIENILKTFNTYLDEQQSTSGEGTKSGGLEPGSVGNAAGS